MVMTQSKPSYVLGYDEAEYARLAQQAAALEPATREALTAVGVKTGWRCLDVACGTGAVTRVLGEMVGGTGAVHAVDLDTRHAQATIAKLREAGPDIYTSEDFDVTGAAAPKGAPYDLVYTRLLICHMRDPVAVLKRLWSFVAPGGVLLVQDFDMGVLHVAPPIAAVEEAFVVLQEVFRSDGKDYRAGASMPHYFMQAAIGAPDGIRIASTLAPSRAVKMMLFGVIRSLGASVARLRIKRAEEMDRLLGDLQQEPPAEAWLRIPDLISTWKRRHG
jgi:ubiquinone/menaquinone biosynthesis C-methylase UbiE